AIALYIEGQDYPRRLMAAAKRARGKKPIVALKVGGARPETGPLWPIPVPLPASGRSTTADSGRRASWGCIAPTTCWTLPRPCPCVPYPRAGEWRC
ncbi:MAG: hypothetical protein JRJ60_23130, partial [Deltaproteobacteria bacterium]|nr:hypothetical protein [Deltaproteobacteria bacterium]